MAFIFLMVLISVFTVIGLTCYIVGVYLGFQSGFKQGLLSLFVPNMAFLAGAAKLGFKKNIFKK